MLRFPLRVWMRAVALLVAMLMTTVGLSACTTSQSDASSTSGSVGDKGFALKLPGVTVSAPAGVAKSGTVIKVAKAASLTPRAQSNLIHDLGTTIKITLGDGEQPLKPITLRFKLDRSKIPAGKNVYAVLSREDGSSNITAVQGNYNAKTSIMTVTTTHLSWYDPVFMSLSDFVNKVSTTLNVAFKASFPAPSKCDTNANLSGGIYSTYAVGAVIPCLSIGNNKVVVELHSTKGIPVTVSTSPGGFAATSDISTTPDDVVVHTVVKLVLGQRGSELFGGETLKYSFENSKPIRSLTYTNDFITMTLFYVASVFETILENGTGAKAMKEVERAARLKDALSCFQDSSGILDLKDPSKSAEVAGVILKGMSTCIGVIPGAGAAWGLITMIPSVAINYSALVGEELLGAKTQTIVIKQIGSPAAPVTTASADTYLLYDGTTSKAWGFISPDDNLRCNVTFERGYYGWGCLARSHDWPDTDLPPVSDGCSASGKTSDPGSLYGSTYEGVFHQGCADPSELDEYSYSALSTNSKAIFGDITCTSTTVSGVQQIACTGPKKSAFTMSKAKVSYSNEVR